MLNELHHKRAYQYIANTYSPPIHALQDPGGNYVTSPDAIDALLRNTWHGVYQGNVANIVMHIAQYVSKYAPFLYRAGTVSLEAITAQDLYTEIQDADPTSPGLDLWSYADLKLLPMEAFHAIAQILTLVEQGAPWP